jgi:TniQ
MAHGLKLHTFCTLLFGKRSIWNRDIDKCSDDRILTIVARRTGTTLERARLTTLASYEGALYERHNALGNTPWIMPLGIYHRVRRLHGTQYCPACLAEDKESYFRCEWRLAFVTVCTSHRRLLFDACPRCDAAINFHRDELGERSKQVATGMARCFKCKFDLRRVSSLAPRDICCDSIDYQSKLIRAVTDRWIDLGSNQMVYAVLYFPVLRQLMKLLAARRGSRLLTALCREIGVPPFPPYFATRKAEIESLRIAERHQLKALAAYLLEDWGERFVKICLAGRVWSSTLLRDFESAPFWYWNIIRAHLYRTSYHATTAEITAAIAHINLSGGVAYQKAISDLLGVQNVFRKRKTLANFSRSTIGRSIVKVAKVK